MLRSKKEISRVSHQKSNLAYGNLTAPILAIAGLLINILPSTAVDTTYSNEYRACTARLLSVSVPAQAAAQDCATAIRPRDLSACVADIKKKTQIEPTDALSYCRKARRPKELAACVVGISQNTQNAVNPAVLDYCSRSLMPTTYANCVVGLRKQIDLAPTQALETCINASERAGGIPASTGFSPIFKTSPVPATPKQ